MLGAGSFFITPEVEFHLDSDLSCLFPYNLTAVKLIPAGESTSLMIGGGAGWIHNLDGACQVECLSYAGIIARAGLIKRTGRKMFIDAMYLTRNGNSTTTLRVGIAS